MHLPLWNSRGTRRNGALLATFLAFASLAGAADDEITIPESGLPATAGSNAPAMPLPMSGNNSLFITDGASGFDYVGSFVLGEKEEGQIPIVGGTIGGGYFVADAENPAKYTGYFDALPGVPVDFKYDSTYGHYAYEVFGAPGIVLPSQYQEAPPILGWGGFPGMMTFWFNRNPYPWISSVDFEQFMTLTVSIVVKNPDGTTSDIPLPPGMTIPITSNGGGSVHNPATGQGMVDVSGQTQYVDSASGAGVAGYIAGGGAGSTVNGVTTMMDAPMPNSPTALAALQAAINGGLIPAGCTPLGVRFRFDFTTYLLIDGNIAWVWYWYAEWVFDLTTGNVVGGCRKGPAPDGPASALTPNQQLAHNDFTTGGFAGAPAH